MRRILAATLVTLAITLSTPAVSGAPKGDESIKLDTLPKTGAVITIDNIQIPEEILMYVQLKYQGFSVVKAEKSVRNGGEIYRLRVDNDDQMKDGEGFYLIFDQGWRQIGEEKAVPPPKPVEVKPPEIQPTPAPVAPVEAAPQPVPVQDEGGRGGGEEEEEEEIPTVPDEPSRGNRNQE